MILLDSGDRWDLREEDHMFCELFFSAQKQALVGFFPCDVFPNWQVRVSRFYQRCCLPDLNGMRQSAVGTAGPQLREPDPSGHCGTSIASARCRIECQIEYQKRCKIECQMECQKMSA